VSYCNIIYAAAQHRLILFVVSCHYKYTMIIFTPQRAFGLQNPKFFDVTCAIGKNAGLKFLPDITHCDRPWNTMHVTLTSADPNTVMRFTKWEHVEFFKNSDRKKIIILDQFQPHYHLRKHTGQQVCKLPADQYYPRPGPGIDYSWADLIICIQEEMAYGSEWIDFLNDPDGYFKTSPGRVISILAGTGDDIDSNLFPYNALSVPLNSWGAWTVASNTPVKYDPGQDRPYKFEALLGGAKGHRKLLFDLLRRNQLLEHGLVSISAQTYVSSAMPESYENVYYRTPELDRYDTPEMVVLREHSRHGGWVAHSTHSLGIEHFPVGNGKTVLGVPPYGSFFIPHGVYQNSWFSVVAETNSTKCNFFTEKTAKVLFGRRIFVTFGPQHSLRELRNIGFKTFSPWIDESYDEEPDNVKRWTQAFEQLVKLINHLSPQDLYDQAHSVLEHNYHRIANPKAMLGPINNFIQSFLNGTAEPDPTWQPMPHGDGYDRMMQEIEQDRHLDLPEFAVESFVVTHTIKLPGSPSYNRMMQEIEQDRRLDLPSSPIQNNSDSLLNVIEIPKISDADALEQARANTQARRAAQNSKPTPANNSRRVDTPEILTALEQARANTQARRAAQVI